MTFWARLLSLLRAIPAKGKWALAGLAALAVVILRAFFAGKSRGRAAGAAEQRMEAAQEDVARVQDAAARGDDDAVQRELARATERAKQTRGRRR